MFREASPADTRLLGALRRSITCSTQNLPPHKPDLIPQLKREVTKLKAERDILKKPRPTSRRT